MSYDTWTPAEKVMVRRVLRAIRDSAHTGLVSGILHPDNGSPVSPSETLISTANFFASIWGIQLDGIPVAPPNPHREPRKLKRKKGKSDEAGQ